MYVGCLVSNKRVDHLIRALALVRSTVPHAHLALVGCDFEGIAKDLMVLADGLGVRDAIAFVGQVSDCELADWLARAHLFVSASEYEGFGISVLEAMSTGTPAVVNPLPSFLTFIENEKNSFLADFARPEDAALALGLPSWWPPLLRIGGGAALVSAAYLATAYLLSPKEWRAVLQQRGLGILKRRPFDSGYGYERSTAR